jgi:hypothetical protein
MNAPVANGEADAGLDDDDAVDLLTQTQHVSGRSDQEQLHSGLVQATENGEIHDNGTGDMAFPESLEPYEEVAQDDTEISSEEDEDEETDNMNGFNGQVESEAVQTQGLVDLEAFLDGEEDTVEEEEEMEEEEKIEERADQALEDPNLDEQDKEAGSAEQIMEDDTQAIASTKASLGDAADMVELEQETLETQESWNIRKGKAGPVQPQQIIRGAQSRYAPETSRPVLAELIKCNSETVPHRADKPRE